MNRTWGEFSCHAGRWLIIAVFGAVAACAPKLTHHNRLDRHLMHQEYTAALALMDESKAQYAERNAALFYMEHGLVAYYAGRHQRSIRSLLKAEHVIEDLYTRSVSKQAASFIINDNTIPYRGEDFEDSMVNLFLALNYSELGLHEEALVEARQVDAELNLINSRYEPDQQNAYKEDAFIRFLMGVLYEIEGEINDAFISYRKAEAIYRSDYLTNYGVAAPDFLIENLLCCAERLGFLQEAAEIQRRYPQVRCADPRLKQAMAEIIFIHYNGRAPEKVERYWLVPMPDGYIAKIAYPAFEPRPYRIADSTLHLEDSGSSQIYRSHTVVMEDIGAIASMNLENRMTRIKLKAIARATTKYAATKAAANEAEEQGGEWAGLLVQVAGNLAGLATEKADLRHWRSLPDEIRIGRMLVPPGRYTARIEFSDSGGNVLLSRRVAAFAVRGGETKFISQRTLN
jgi:hypothetical protein